MMTFCDFLFEPKFGKAIKLSYTLLPPKRNICLQKLKKNLPSIPI